MKLFDIFKNVDINQGIEEFKKLDNAYLIDVREEEEYLSGHIPNSKNIALSKIEDIKDIIKDKNANIFLYCRSGNRSKIAEKKLQSIGYKFAKNIGGINTYKGNILR